MKERALEMINNDSGYAIKLWENHWVLGIEIQLRILKVSDYAHKTSPIQKWVQSEKSVLWRQLHLRS